jgi:hypothetical protein
MKYMTRNVSGCVRSVSGGSLAAVGPCLWLLVACSGSKVGGAAHPSLGAGTGATAPVTMVAGTGGPATAVAGTGTAATGAVTGGVAGIGVAGVGSKGTAGTGTGGASGTGAAGTGAAGMAMVSAGAGGAQKADRPAGGSCLDGITDYENAGPFKFETKVAGQVKLWVPMVPAGCKVPIVHLANGTTATCANYQGALERLASHGFLTACYEDPNTGAGTQGIMAIEAAMMMYPDLWDKKIGSTGHSQGGQSAFVMLELAEAKYTDGFTFAGLAMEPASGFGTKPTEGTWQSVYAKVKSPMFMFSGDSAMGYANSSLAGMSKGDGLVGISWVQEGFDALSKTIEAYHWTAVGATHIPTPVGPEQQVSIPWFRWKLLGDTAACNFFKKMADGTKWKMQKEQNVMDCPP